MVPLPRVCSGCRVAFDVAEPLRRLALLENGRALCGNCAWLVDHADGERAPRQSSVVPTRSWDPAPA